SRKKLAGRDTTLAQAALAVTEAESALQAKRAQIDGLSAELDGLTRQRDDVLKQLKDISTIFAQYNFKADPAEPELAQVALLDEQEEIARLERALFILDASGAADRVATWQNRVNGLR